MDTTRRRGALKSLLKKVTDSSLPTVAVNLCKHAIFADGHAALSSDFSALLCDSSNRLSMATKTVCREPANARTSTGPTYDEIVRSSISSRGSMMPTNIKPHPLHVKL